MLKLLLGCVFALSVSQIGSATVVVAVGTKDGILVCEDTRITQTDQDRNQTFIDSVHKAQRHGAFGFSAAGGDLAYSEPQIIGGSTLLGSPSNYDILAEIRSFFEANDIRQFDNLMAARFESRLTAELQKTFLTGDSRFSLGPPRVLEVSFFWIDYFGQPKWYGLDLINQWPPDPPSPSSLLISPLGTLTLTLPPIKGQYPPLSNFATSKPVVMSGGRRVYNEISSGEKKEFDEVRLDPALKPFLTDFVDADSLDALPTTRAIKVLIRKISEKQDFVRAGIGVGPESDCFLLANGGVRDMNQEVAEADEREVKGTSDFVKAMAALKKNGR
jgi:hypothetical protein